MSEPMIAIESLRKEYDELVAVDDVTLAIPSGEIFGLIGPNGAGKTSLLRMLATTMEPTAGSVRIGGRDVWEDPRRTRSIIGFMPDFFQLYKGLRLWELLTYFGMAHGLSGRTLSARVDDVLALIDLEHKREALVAGLSRGMVQRLGMGRALMHKPPVLLLDEPASGLDPQGRRTIFDVLRKVRADGCTIIISSHILDELSELCTSVGIMHDGRFLEAGPRDVILKKILPARAISILTPGLAAKAAMVLAGIPSARNTCAEGDRVNFDFDGSDTDLAAVNAALVAAGVAPALIEERRSTLHELYFAITERAQHAASA